MEKMHLRHEAREWVGQVDNVVAVSVRLSFAFWLWSKEEWSFVAGRVERFIQAAPHKRKPISRAEFCCCLHLSLSFTAHFLAASPTHTNPNICHLYLLPLVAPYTHTYTGERLAFAAESVCFFFSQHQDGPRPRQHPLLLTLHTHPPTCLQSPLLHTTSHTPASCALSCNGRSGTRLSMSATSPRSLKT